MESFRATKSLQRSYVFRLGTFLTLAYLHGDLLALMQRAAPGAIYGAEMHEDILATFAFNESEAFFVIEPLDHTFY